MCAREFNELHNQCAHTSHAARAHVYAATNVHFGNTDRLSSFSKKATIAGFLNTNTHMSHTTADLIVRHAERHLTTIGTLHAPRTSAFVGPMLFSFAGVGLVIVTLALVRHAAATVSRDLAPLAFAHPAAGAPTSSLFTFAAFACGAVVCAMLFRHLAVATASTAPRGVTYAVARPRRTTVHFSVHTLSMDALSAAAPVAPKAAKPRFTIRPIR